MRIGWILQDARRMRRTGVREMAKIIGLSPATLSRVENGKQVSGKTIGKLLVWLMADDDATRTKPARKQGPILDKGWRG